MLRGRFQARRFWRTLLETAPINLYYCSNTGWSQQLSAAVTQVASILDSFGSQLFHQIRLSQSALGLEIGQPGLGFLRPPLHSSAE